jgi:hypothetical protein
MERVAAISAIRDIQVAFVVRWRAGGLAPSE